MITNDMICRPKNIYSDTIWELYKLLQGSEIRYMWYSDRKRENLCLIESVELIAGDVCYAQFSEGALPSSKDESVLITPSDIENGEKKKYYPKITVNGLFKCYETTSELLKSRGLRFASEEDIRKAGFRETEQYYNGSALGIPVNEYPVQVCKDALIDAVNDKKNVAESIFNCLHRQHIACKMSSENGLPRVDYVIMSDTVPGEFIRGQAHFYDCTSEVRISYNSVCADIYRESEHKGELYILLNHINAHTFTEQPVTAGETKGLCTSFTPRMFIDEKGGGCITLSVVIDYELRRSRRYQTDDHISQYLPKLLEHLSPYIFGVLKGEMTAEEAISELKKQNAVFWEQQ